MKIGLLGGSFDPIHYGHLYMAKQAKEEYALDQIWFIPAGHSPNKNETEMTSADIRLRMCELAVEEEKNFFPCAIEVKAEETSYTYLTVTKLVEQYPQHEFFFIMGADSLAYFEQWKHPEIICEKVTLLVVNRDDFSDETLRQKGRELNSLFPARIHIVHCKKYDISSHEIRERIRCGASVEGDVPKKVLEYIRSKKMYQE